MAFNREKFKSLVHYVCWRCMDDPSKLGAVKLNKILWLADFTAYYQSGEPITGARYVKRQFGPVPSAIKPALRALADESRVVTREVPFHGYAKVEYEVLEDADPSIFTSDQLEIVDEIIRVVRDEHTAKSISAISHDHIWHAAEDGEEIPYFTIFAIPGEVGKDELDWAKQELELEE